MPGGYDQRAPRRNTYIIGDRQPGTVAPPAGLWAGRTDEDRDRPGGDRGRGPPFSDHRFAGSDADSQPGLAELDGSPAGGRYRWRRGEAQAAHPSAAGARRSGGGPQVPLFRSLYY